MTATPACMRPQFSVPSWLEARTVSVTGRVNLDSSVTRIRAAKNSFHEAKNVNRAVLMSPGIATGNKTRAIALTRPHPSTRAASQTTRQSASV